MIVEVAPTAQTLEALEPEMAERFRVVPEAWDAHEVPFQKRTVPPSPTVQTLVSEVPQMPLRSTVTPEGWGVQVAPPSVVWLMEPEAPTAQPTVVEAIQTASLERGSAKVRQVDVCAWTRENAVSTVKVATVETKQRNVLRAAMRGK